MGRWRARRSVPGLGQRERQPKAVLLNIDASDQTAKQDIQAQKSGETCLRPSVASSNSEAEADEGFNLRARNCPGCAGALSLWREALAELDQMIDVLSSRSWA